jgi:hypothetical protein
MHAHLDTIPEGARVFQTAKGLASFLRPILSRRRGSAKAACEIVLADLEATCERVLHGRGVGPGDPDAAARQMLARATEISLMKGPFLRIFKGYAVYTE